MKRALAGTLVLLAFCGVARAQAPTIAALTPQNGAVGATVVITGMNLTGANAVTAVSFNGTPATFIYIDNDHGSVFVTVPAGATTGAVTVTTARGNATSAAPFTVGAAAPTPTITNVDPQAAPAGAILIVTGTNFTGATAATFNGLPATLTVTGAGRALVNIPKGATSGRIAITTPNGSALSAVVKVLPDIAVNSFLPAFGPAGTKVTVTGAGFTGAAQVAFNGTAAASFKVLDDTHLVATVAAGSTTGVIQVTSPFATVAASANNYCVGKSGDCKSPVGASPATCSWSQAVNADAGETSYAPNPNTTCRVSRRDRGPLQGNLNLDTSVLPVNRYIYSMCKSGVSCQHWSCKDGKPVRDMACDWTRTGDALKVAESQCTSDNNYIRTQVQTCLDSLSRSAATGGAPVVIQGGYVFPRGNQTNVYLTPTSTDPCAGAAFWAGGPSGTTDSGIGGWFQKQLEGDKDPSLLNQSYFTDEMGTINSDYREYDTQPMSALARDTPGTTPATVTWTESYSQKWNWYERISWTGRLYTRGAFAALGNRAAPLWHVGVCKMNKGSIFFEGYNNPRGKGATATPANGDISTSQGNTELTAYQLLQDSTSVLGALMSDKTQQLCDQVSSAWSGGACDTLPDRTWSHSLGAITTRSYGLQMTGATIGSVDNLGGDSYKNNCDIIPAIATTYGLTIIQMFPTPQDVQNYQCTPGQQTNCLFQDPAKGNNWVWKTFDNPVSAGPAVVRKWCAGKPVFPKTQIWTGRDTLQTTLTGRSTNLCDRQDRALSSLFVKCPATNFNGIGAWVTCIGAILTTKWSATDGINDHVLLGKPGAVDYNSYQVIDGLDNLGRPSRDPQVRVIAFENRYKPMFPPPPDCRNTGGAGGSGGSGGAGGSGGSDGGAGRDGGSDGGGGAGGDGCECDFGDGNLVPCSCEIGSGYTGSTVPDDCYDGDGNLVDCPSDCYDAAGDLIDCPQRNMSQCYDDQGQAVACSADPDQGGGLCHDGGGHVVPCLATAQYCYDQTESASTCGAGAAFCYDQNWESLNCPGTGADGGVDGGAADSGSGIGPGYYCVNQQGAIVDCDDGTSIYCYDNNGNVVPCGGTPGDGGCTPTTSCALQGYPCGAVWDGCEWQYCGDFACNKVSPPPFDMSTGDANPDAGIIYSPPDLACAPNCQGVACGTGDGCGGLCCAGSGCAQPTCGPCQSLSTCGGLCVAVPNGSPCLNSNEALGSCQSGVCVCTPACSGRSCGPDGCGGLCGSCPPPSSCDFNGQCGCTPNCQGVACGASDGCGGVCCAGGGCIEPSCGPCQSLTSCGAGCLPIPDGVPCSAPGVSQGSCQSGLCQCAPSCQGVACGASDGCGGVCVAGSGCTQPSCGPCQSLDNTGGVCVPVCDGTACTTDNNAVGTCQSGGCVCTPVCKHEACGGSDGCGGTCCTGSRCKRPHCGPCEQRNGCGGCDPIADGTDCRSNGERGTCVSGACRSAFQVQVQSWQKDAYQDKAGSTAGWPQHTTIGVSVVDLATGVATLRCEADNHGSAIAGGLVTKSGDPQNCNTVFGTLAEAQQAADDVCACTCDSMGANATTFLSDNVSADLKGLSGFLNQVKHAELNKALACAAAAGADPTQRLIDDLKAAPPNFADGLTMLTTQCTPNWTKALKVLLGAAWDSYHVCNNDAALEQRACQRGYCPSFATESTAIKSICNGPRILGP